MGTLTFQVNSTFQPEADEFMCFPTPYHRPPPLQLSLIREEQDALVKALCSEWGQNDDEEEDSLELVRLARKGGLRLLSRLQPLRPMWLLFILSTLSCALMAFRTSALLSVMASLIIVSPWWSMDAPSRELFRGFR